MHGCYIVASTQLRHALGDVLCVLRSVEDGIWVTSFNFVSFAVGVATDWMFLVDATAQK